MNNWTEMSQNEDMVIRSFRKGGIILYGSENDELNRD